MLVLKITSYMLLVLYLALSIIFYVKLSSRRKHLIRYSAVILIVLCLITVLSSSNDKSKNDISEADQYMLKLEQMGTPKNIIIKATSENQHKKDDFEYAASRAQTDAKISAYVDNASPQKNSTIYLMVLGPEGGKVTAICHYKDGDRPYMGVIKKDGKLILPLPIGDAESGYTVVIDVLVDYNGRNYKTNAGFTPQ